MKKLLFVLAFSVATITHAQQVYATGGWTIASFDFVNNEGQSLDNLESKTQNYFGVGYRTPILAKGLNLNAGATYNSYGATGSDPALNNFFDWDVDYLGLGLALDYVVNAGSELEVFIKGGFSAEWMVQGTQRINNQVFDIRKTEEFDDTAYFFRGGGGASYPISDRSRLYIEYSYGQSLALNDNNNSQVTELKINTHMIGLGIQIDITNDKTDGTSDEEDNMDTPENTPNK